MSSAGRRAGAMLVKLAHRVVLGTQMIMNVHRAQACFAKRSRNWHPAVNFKVPLVAHSDVCASLLHHVDDPIDDAIAVLVSFIGWLLAFARIFSDRRLGELANGKMAEGPLHAAEECRICEVRPKQDGKRARLRRVLGGLEVAARPAIDDLPFARRLVTRLGNLE